MNFFEIQFHEEWCGTIAAAAHQREVLAGEFQDLVEVLRRARQAGAWVDDLKANALRRPRLVGTNFLDDMAGLDVIFIGVGVPRKEGQSRRDLLRVNTEVVAETSRQIRELYEGCSSQDLPILVYMGNPVTAMTWVGYKVTGFPRENIMGQAGNLDTRRICHAVSQVLGISGTDMQGIVFGEHGDSMVAHPRYFSVSGIPLEDIIRVAGIDPQKIRDVMDEAKKGGTHFVNETGQSASAGPARAACDMLRAMVKGESEVQPVIAIIGPLTPTASAVPTLSASVSPAE